MSEYIPLYRKYRPQALNQLIGQDAIVQTLSNAITYNQLSHAYLFCGPRGTGKTSSARILAKSINCQQGPTLTPCQTCPSCMAITAGNALDVIEIDAASNNGVDQIRELTERVQFMAIEGKYRIYIIDEVHMLSTAAFNALLKTLEEPPENVIFIFATTEAHKVLPTIVSRCQRFDFSRITQPQIETQLKQIALSEAIEIEAEAIAAIAKFARGGMRDALSMLDQVSVYGMASQNKQPIGKDLVRLVIGHLPEENLIALTNAIAQNNPPALISQLDALNATGVDTPQLIKALLGHFRHLLLIQSCLKNNSPLSDIERLLDVSPQFLEALIAQSKLFSPEEFPQILLRLSQLETQLRSATNQALWLEICLLELCFRQDIYQFEALAKRIEALETQILAQPVVQPLASKPPASASPSPTRETMPKSPSQKAPALPKQNEQPIQNETLQPEPLKSEPISETPALQSEAQENTLANAADSLSQLGQQIFEAIESIPVKSLLLQHCQLYQQTAEKLFFGFSAEGIFVTFNRPDKVKLLEAAVARVLGKPYRIHLEVRAAVSQAPTQAEEPAAGKAEISQSQKQPILSEQASVNPDNPEALSKDALPEEATPPNYALNDAKRFTQELLQARVID